MIISQLSVAPIGQGTSLSKYVKIVIKILKKYNLKFETNAMSTVIQTKELTKLFDAIKEINFELFEVGSKRIITELKIDNRIDKEATIETKLKSIK